MNLFLFKACYLHDIAKAIDLLDSVPLFHRQKRKSTMIADTDRRKENKRKEESDSHIPNRLFSRNHILFSHNFCSESLAHDFSIHSIEHIRNPCQIIRFFFLSLPHFKIYSKTDILNFNAMR